MNNFFKSFFGAFTTFFNKFFNKLQLLTSADWWRTRGFVALREFFQKLFDVKPRHKKDYYSVFRWLVSKRLAFALIIVIGGLSIYYILVLSPLSPMATDRGADSIPIYKYNSIPLRLVSGDVRIRAHRGYVAYVGAVERGQVKGQGQLFAEDGSLVYEGEFDRNMYNGLGRLYYPTGGMKYEGEFADNLYHGNGREFRLAGSLEFIGEFLHGMRHGQGQLYNASGVQIYEGTFHWGQLLYSELLGKPTSEIAQMYTGLQNVYSFDTDFCVELLEIGAVYSIDGSQNTLEAEWTVKNIIVLSDTISIGNEVFDDINMLSMFFGTPDYSGALWVNLAEAVAINLLNDRDTALPVSMEKSAVFDNVFNVTDFDMDYNLYVFSYRNDGLLYTFYCTSASAREFFMYSIEVD
jgi:hypothetical protein